MKTCIYCGNKYNDEWKNWYGKYCCSKCYHNKVSKYTIGDKVYTYDNRKLEDGSGFEVVLVTGAVTKIYEIQHPNKNGLYQYVISFNDKSVYRFEHQITKDLNEMLNTVEIINRTREIKRQANQMIKEINNNGTM